VDVFPNLSRKIGERKYIVQNVFSLFKFYESTFGNLYFDWIETHSPASKLTKSRTYSGIVKVDAKGEQKSFIYNSLILTLSFNNGSLILTNPERHSSL